MATIDIDKIRDEKKKELELRVNTNSSSQEKHILVCHGTGCTSSKSPKIIENFKRIIEEKARENIYKAFNEKFFNKEEINAIFKEYIDGNSDNWRKVYVIYTFLVWYEEYFIKR